MQTTPKLRILPVLIIVAMLAFSVRLVDFATGVSSLSGSAMAEDKMQEDQGEMMPDEAMLDKMDDAAMEKAPAAMAAKDDMSTATSRSSVSKMRAASLGFIPS